MPLLDVKPVREFTRDQPCTKVDLWNAFRRDGRFVSRAFVEVRGEIGINAPKYLRREGFAIMVEEKGIDYLCLTKTGVDWLTRGVVRYLELHPEEMAKLEQPLPRGIGNALGAAVAKAAPKTAQNAPVIRRIERNKRG